MAALDRMNGIAERSPGFVWRLKSDGGGNATDIKVADDPRFIVNMSVWETPEHLEHFVWSTVPKRVYARKSEFTAPTEAHLVMWWVPARHVPTVEEAMARLGHLVANGPGAHAFGWESLPNIKRWREQRCA